MVCLVAVPQWFVCLQCRSGLFPRRRSSRMRRNGSLRRRLYAHEIIGAPSWLACPATVCTVRHLRAIGNDVLHCQFHTLACASAQRTALLHLCPLTRNSTTGGSKPDMRIVTCGLSPTFLAGYSCGHAYPRRCLARVSDEERHGAEGPTTRGEASQFRNRDGATQAWRPFACARRLRAHTSGGMGLRRMLVPMCLSLLRPTGGGCR